jgi:hypothetical protein
MKVVSIWIKKDKTIIYKNLPNNYLLMKKKLFYISKQYHLSCCCFLASYTYFLNSCIKYKVWGYSITHSHKHADAYIKLPNPIYAWDSLYRFLTFFGSASFA